MILRQVKLLEGDHLPNIGVDLVALADLLEVAVAPLPGAILAEGPLAVQALAREVQRLGVDVGRQDRDRPIIYIGQQFAQQDSDGVWLLAARASGAPDAQGAQRAPAFDDLRQDVMQKRIELPPVAEKVTLANRERVDQSLEMHGPVIGI